MDGSRTAFAAARGMIFIQHQSRVFGMQLPIYDNDSIGVYTGSRHEIATLTGAIVRQLIEHHLASVALQHAVASSISVGAELPPTPYRRSLLRMPLDQPAREERAVARRARRRRA